MAKLLTGNLTDKMILDFSPVTKEKKHADSSNLILRQMPNGSLLWRLKFFLSGIEGSMSLGSYPITRIQAARQLELTNMEKVQRGINPSTERKKKASGKSNCFEAVAREWLAKKLKPSVAKNTYDQTEKRLEKWAFKIMGKTAITEITPADVLALLDLVADLGHTATCMMVKQDMSRVFKYGSPRFGNMDPTSTLSESLPTHKVTGFAKITDPRKFGPLLRELDRYDGREPTVMIALKLIPHLMLRPSEMRCGEWTEIDWDNKIWRIPAHKMKKRREHLVPLSRQVLALLKELQKFSGEQRLMFPTSHDPSRAMNKDTINTCLRKLDYNTETQHCAHGFRGSASTMLNELDCDPRAVDMQLAHWVGGVEGKYNAAEKLPQRVVMMQLWSDYIDMMKSSANATETMRLRLKASSARGQHLHLVA